MSVNTNIKQVQPSPTVEIHLPESQTLSGPRGAQVGEFLHAFTKSLAQESGAQAHPSTDFPGDYPLVVAAVVNGQLRELTYPIEIESEVTPVTTADPDGARIYRRSLTFLLEYAFEQLFPEGVLTIDHSVSSGGYFCQVSERPSLSMDDLLRLEAHMLEIVDQDLPFQRINVPLEEAVELFKAKGHEDKVRLLAYRKKDYLTLYQLGESKDYFHGYMVPSTGYLRWFALNSAGDGFTLRFPRRHKPSELLPLPEYPKLLQAFRLYGDWLWRLGISSAGALNDAIHEGRIREIILVSEALHELRVSEIAAQIAARFDTIRVVLIAGPSSSGKTTFSKRLSIQLLAHGLSPFPLELDNYFLDRDKTPLDETGAYDFESIAALDTIALETDISRLTNGEKVQLPRYNFLTGLREPGEEVKLAPGQIIILEGIHGLNSALIPDIPAEQTFRIYVSALTQLNLDRHNRVSTTDTRLLRRIVRDARERGYTAVDTIHRWESVRRGEKRYIFPFQENADVMFNSALAYELAVLKPLAEPLLRQVPFGTPEYIEAKRLLAFLEWFLPLDYDLVPDNSLLREFIGGSILKAFKLWHNGTHQL